MDFTIFHGDEAKERFTDLKPKDIDTKLSVIVTKDGYIEIAPDEKIGVTPVGMANAAISLAITALRQYGDDNGNDMEGENELANRITFAIAAAFSSILGGDNDELGESE